MKNQNQRNPTAKLGRLEDLRDGLAEVFLDRSLVFKVSQKDRPVSDLLAEADSYIVVYKDAETAHQALTTAVDARDKVESKADLFLQVMEDTLRGYYGRRAQGLKKFGIPPKKGGKELNVHEKAKKVDKALASRKANRTMGPRQKREAKKQAEGQAGQATPPAPAPNPPVEPAK